MNDKKPESRDVRSRRRRKTKTITVELEAEFDVPDTLLPWERELVAPRLVELLADDRRGEADSDV